MTLPQKENYAKFCQKYWNVYHLVSHPEPNCLNCYYSDDKIWDKCSIAELQTKKAFFEASQVKDQKTLENVL